MVLFFIDGLGMGKDNESINPLISEENSLFEKILGTKLVERECPLRIKNGALIPTDATLGVEGIPQSATGQTTIFTGINAAKELGSHFSAYPPPTLAKIIEEHSVVKKLKEKSIRATSANLYSTEFFEKRENSGRNLFPVTTLSVMAASEKFRFYGDYANDMAVYTDITNQLLRERGKNIPLITGEKAATNIKNILSENNFVFFEYYISDTYGHACDRKKIYNCVKILNEFVYNLWNIIKDEASLVIISDHGNIEDISIQTHTFNKVPCIVLSKEKTVVKEAESRINSLTDITPFILWYFTN